MSTTHTSACLSVLLALLPGCTDEYDELYGGCPEDGDCFFNQAEWEKVKSLTCLGCDPGLPMGPLPPSPTNDFADDPAARFLGEAIFCDSELGPHDFGCANCHKPDAWFTADLGRRPGGDDFRGITSVIDAAYYDWHAWHGKTDELWKLAQGAMEKGSLVDGNRVAIAHRVYDEADYAAEFIAVFGEPELQLDDLPPSGKPDASDPGLVDRDLVDAWNSLNDDQRTKVEAVLKNVAFALEAYMRQVTSGPTPFDAYVRGDGDIGESAKRGLALFIGGRGSCISCHSGPRMTDGEFHNIGLPILPETTDRASAVLDLVTNAPLQYPELDPDDPALVGAFRTPTLRNVDMTQPYMHTSEFATLPQAVWHYDETAEGPDGGLDDLMWSRELSNADVEDIVAFLHTLTSTEGEWIGSDPCPTIVE